jgi:predicted NBD/HSP70 family sugar kinase
MSEQMIIGVDIGGTKINSILADSDGNIKSKDLRDTRAKLGPDAVIERIIESIRQVVSGNTVEGIGIGAAGACDTANGVITSSPGKTSPSGTSSSGSSTARSTCRTMPPWPPSESTASAGVWASTT